MERIISILIPTIKSFHENMNYLAIGINIVRGNLLGKLRRGESVFEAMRAIWQRPERCLIEHDEGLFQEAASTLGPDLAYKQVLISALRKFPYLSGFAPRVDRGDDTVRPGIRDLYLARFFHHA